MIRKSLKNPEPHDTDVQIMWHNLKVADEFLDLSFFISSSLAWLKLNPTKNYQDLEKELRDNNFNTHLYAKKPRVIPNSKLWLYKNDDSETYEYECIFSCRPKDDALKEVLSFSNSYEENFDKLKKAGSVMIKDIINDKSPYTKIFTETEKSNYGLISENKRKLFFEKVSPNNYLNEMVKLCKDEYHKDPIEKIVGMTKQGGPIFGLFLDDKLVSEIGFLVEHNSNGDKIMKLYDLKNLF